MKILRQFSIILFLSFLGEGLKMLLPLPIPASVYGLMLMLLALCTGILKVEQVKDAAVFFIPAAVGLLESWDALRPVVVPVLMITVITTVIVIAVTGLVTQIMIRKRRKKNERVSE